MSGINWGTTDCLVLAAGKSTRIMEVSGGKPKPLLELLGKSLLGHNLSWLEREGVRTAYVNVHYRKDEIIDHLRKNGNFGLDIEILTETKILGTAGAVKNIPDLKSSNILVVYGDNFSRFSLEKMYRQHLAKDALVTIALFDFENHPNSGIAGGRVVYDRQTNEILNFREGLTGQETAGYPYVNAGVCLLKPEVLQSVENGQFCDFGKDIFPEMLRSGKRIEGYLIEEDGFCFGLDTVESYNVALVTIKKSGIKKL